MRVQNNKALRNLRKKAFCRLIGSVTLSLFSVLIYVFVLRILFEDTLEWGVFGTMLVLSIPIVIGVGFELPLLVLKPRRYAELKGLGILLRAIAVVLCLIVYGEVWPRWFGLGLWIPDPVDNLVVLGLVAAVSSIASTAAIHMLGRSAVH